MSITDNIFNIMSNRGMTQKELSKRTHIPESTISDWKKKGNTPGAEKLSCIASALGVSVSELISEESTLDEQIILDIYRTAPEDIRRRIIQYVKGLASVQGSREIIATKGDGNTFIPDTELIRQKQLAYKLRRLARLDRIRLDMSEHVSGNNLHLIKYLEYIGLDALTYVKRYLSNIQPFMIVEMASQEKFDNAICVLDNYYRISVYIKVDATRGEEVIVSFHENHKRGIAKRNPIRRDRGYVYVFAESVGSFVESTKSYTINLFITRGATTFPINVPATRYDEDGFVVNYTYINNALVDIANHYMEDLYTADLEFDDIELFSSLQQLSFTSYGNDVFSNISLLIDSILIQKDYVSQQVADSALCIYCGTINMLDSDKKELIDVLRQRFSVNFVRALPEIIARVEMNLL